MGPGIFIMWIVLSIVLGAIGSNRKIGFAGAFFASLLLSPLIGLIITLTSSKRDFKKEGAQTMYSKASKKFNKGEYEEAVNMYKQSMNMNGTDPKTHFNLAMCYNHMENFDLALKHLARSVELGFADYERIENDYNLEKLRQTDKFKQFSEKGYKL
jgi:tetratricopeptide (TPR) repeat protein